MEIIRANSLAASDERYQSGRDRFSLYGFVRYACETSTEFLVSCEIAELLLCKHFSHLKIMDDLPCFVQ